MNIPTLTQSPVIFNSEDHTYQLGDKLLKGITSSLLVRAFPDAYAKPPGYTDDEWQEVLNNAAAKGSNMHEVIELYDELGVTTDLPELQSYIALKKEKGLEVIATEYVVSDEQNYATAIDKVMLTPEGDIIIVDLKRTYKIYTEKVALQQSICKRFFERQNPGLKVKGIYVLWLRDDKCQFKELQVWDDKALDELIDNDLHDTPFTLQKTYGDLPARVYDVQQYLRNLEEEVKQKTEELKNIKEGLCAMMIEKGVKQFSTDVLQMTTVTPKDKETFDTKKFAEEHPDLYAKYIKTSKSKPSIRITYK